MHRLLTLPAFLAPRQVAHRRNPRVQGKLSPRCPGHGIQTGNEYAENVICGKQVCHAGLPVPGDAMHCV